MLSQSRIFVGNIAYILASRIALNATSPFLYNYPIKLF
jgi:hypothetical protein